MDANVSLILFGPTTPAETPEQVAGGYRQAGANEMVFFTSLYHGYRLLQPRYPQRAIYTLETDKVFYEPDPSLYEGSVKPERSEDFADEDYVAGMSRACKTEGIRFVPLVPICAGERLVQSRPDLAVVNLYGSRDRLFLCHNNPEVRKYRLAMIRDIVGRYEVDAVMLDKIPQTQLELRAFGGLFDPPLRTVGSLCFCEHCVARAGQAGLDLGEVKARATEIAGRSLKMPRYTVEALSDQLTGDTEIPLLLLEEPLIYQVLQFRFATAVEWVEELGAAARGARPGVEVQAAFVPPAHVGHDATSPRSWLCVQSYKKYRHALDEIVCVVHWGADLVRFETARAVAAVEGKTRVTASMRLYGATRPEDVSALAEAALAGGSANVSFLGYDVTSDELLLALRRWVDSKG